MNFPRDYKNPIFFDFPIRYLKEVLYEVSKDDIKNKKININLSNNKFFFYLISS